MTQIAGYEITEKTGLSRGTIFYKAERHDNGQKVILKTLSNPFPTQEEIYKLKHEYEIVKSLEIKGIPKYYGLEKKDGQHYLIIEDQGGISLNQYLKGNELSQEKFLSLSISIARVLEEVHQKNIIHKNINSDTIWLNPETEEVFLMDFSIASFTYKEQSKLISPKLVEGNLFYISPEQTGRMNRVIDHRCDLYSLGVILYKMVTGEKPFDSRDSMELIHFHIAKAPVPPHLVKQTVPQVISKIILKLMSKNAEDRYHSAIGLAYDLQECRHQLEEGKKIMPFALGKSDFSNKLTISQKLYGRDSEKKILQDLFDRVAGGTSAFLLVKGSSGVGKSAFVHEIQKPVTDKRGYFIEGKFNQFQRNVPYSGFITAFKEFINFVMSDTPNNLEYWRNNILESIGNTGKVLTEVIPSLELLIGKQPDVPELPPVETQNRFNYVCRNFIRALSRRENPLVMFLDDLQWADIPSLELLKVLLSDVENSFFLLIGACRTNDGNLPHAFSLTMEDMQKQGTKIQKMLLENLHYKYIDELVTETINCSSDEARALVDLVYIKTQGNPFFVNEFLKSLFEQNALFFDASQREWRWNMEKIKHLNIPENVVELMAEKVQKLSEETQRVLKLASCIGSSFALNIIAVVSEMSREEVSEVLQFAIREGLIMPRAENFKFSHDKIQQAVYSLIPEKEKKIEHLSIGRLLFKNLRKEEVEEYIFEIVNQFNFALHEISSGEKYRLAELFFTAGKKAKNAAAYAPSLDYFRNGIFMLPESSWQTNYQLTLSFYGEAAESAYLCSELNLMEQWVSIVLKNAKTTLDKVKVYEIRIKAYTGESKLTEAVNTAVNVLALLGIRFPKKPNKSHAMLSLLQVQLSLRGRKIDSLLNMPAMKNETMEAAIRILASVGSAVYFAKPDLLPLFICKAIRLIILYGNTSYSAFVCSSYGILISGGLGNLTGGAKLGSLSLKLMERFPLERLRCRTIMVVNTFLFHWNSHISRTFEPLYQAYQKGMESGDMEFAYYCAMVYCYNKFNSGFPLKELIAEMNVFNIGMSQIEQKTPLLSNSIFTQTAFNLINETPDPTLLNGTSFDEHKTELREMGKTSKTSIFDFNLCKLILCFLFGSYRRAKEYSIHAEDYINFKNCTALLPVFYFYQSLSILAMKDFKPSEKKKLMEKVKRNLEKLRLYAKHAPMNNLQRLYLVEAEVCRVAGKYSHAAPLYDKAIHYARENDFTNEEAICYELTAKFYMENDHSHLAEFYFQKAYRSYYRWGAMTKIKNFEVHYHHFISAVQVTNTSTKFSSIRGGKGFLLRKHNLYPEVPTLGSEVLDLESIMKASIAVSSEIQLDKLLEKLIRIAIENAGAQKGFLVLQKENELFLEAESNVDTDQVILHQAIPVKGNTIIPETIIQFVNMTKENLVVNDAVNDPRYFADPVILQNRVKSILCIPIVNHGNLIGILYFENNLAIGAFTEDRIELLKLLSGQMAVSIENALNEEKKVANFLEREALLKKLNTQQKIISKAIIQTQENERRRIAEDLHDGLGYTLSTLKLNLTSWQENHEMEDQEKYVKNSLILLEESFKELKTISNDLMPDILFNYGLITALEDICNRIKNTGKLNIAFKYFNIEKRFKKDFEIEVFRIIQEIINNVIKHAFANSLEIQVIGQNDYLVITVEDDGKGFDYEKKIKSKKKGKGLVNIVNRVNFLNGKVNYESSEGKGTTIILQFPIRTKAVKELTYD